MTNNKQNKGSLNLKTKIDLAQEKLEKLIDERIVTKSVRSGRTKSKPPVVKSRVRPSLRLGSPRPNLYSPVIRHKFSVPVERANQGRI